MGVVTARGLFGNICTLREPHQKPKTNQSKLIKTHGVLVGNFGFCKGFKSIYSISCEIYDAWPSKKIGSKGWKNAILKEKVSAREM